MVPHRPRAVDAESRSSIATEHRELRRTVDLLENAHEAHLIASLLTHLQGQLAAHFAEEEGDDGLAAIVRHSAPQHLVHLDRLFHEHRDFETRIGDLTERFAAISRELEEVRGAVMDLCRALRDHEERESSLLTEAVYTDIGPGD